MKRERGESIFPILVVTRPSGPERLLFYMRLAENGEIRESEQQVVRLATELPPLAKPSEPDLPDISRFVSVMLIEGMHLRSI